MDKVVPLVECLLLVLLFNPGNGFDCYECNNGNALKPNFDCPAEGDVISSETIQCNGKCYIRTRHGGDGAVVERGCMQTSWMNTYIVDGCDVIENDIWCFCSEDECNGKRLGDWFPIP
ncbi:hypothetical protein SNE40_001257 [Patella caerulea]|uniref:Protein quiver n=1 Tax=Patella caerulea TaxID=87958 RepID=A0AAN8KMK7_PATCE